MVESKNYDPGRLNPQITQIAQIQKKDAKTYAGIGTVEPPASSPFAGPKRSRQAVENKGS